MSQMTQVTQQEAFALAPKALPISPFKGAMALYRLIKNKEDTSQVFKLGRAINGKALFSAFHDFLNQDLFQKVKDNPDYLHHALDKRDQLRALPAGTLGRLYADFMDNEGLDTNGIEEASIEAGNDMVKLRREHPEYYSYAKNNMVNHDLFHIVTGYHRDALGEAALLWFTYYQTKSRANKLIGRFAALNVQRQAKDVPVWAIMKNGAAMGKASVPMYNVDFVALLDKPIEEVRKILNITPCPLYASQSREKLSQLILPDAPQEPEAKAA